MSGITPQLIQDRIVSAVAALDEGDYVEALRFLGSARALMAGIPRFPLERGGEVEWRPEQIGATTKDIEKVANAQQLGANGVRTS
jgi:hypothetical protein